MSIGVARRVRPAILPALLALIALVVETGSVPHWHAAGEPALYDHEHDLFGAVGNDFAALLPGRGPAAPLTILIAVTAALVATLPAATPRGQPRPRAPPVR
jgi:hypothetical protein